MRSKQIIEKQLGISGDYQYKALRSKNYLQANWHRNKWFVINELLKEYQPKKVLDLGTGSGNFELLFSKYLDEITGVDYNDEALEFLRRELKREKITNVKMVNKDIVSFVKLKPKEKYDMIILIDVFEHLDGKSGDYLISNSRKYLDRKGKVVIITPNYRGTWPVIERYIIDKFTRIPHLENMQHVTKFNRNTLSGEFKKRGYKLIKYSTFNTFSYLFPTSFLSEFLCSLELKSTFPFGNLLLCVFAK